jgi:ribulose-phosphate 3-epimerase
VDGGVNSNNAKKLIECGANALVAGSFVFKSKNPSNTISELSSIIN